VCIRRRSDNGYTVAFSGRGTFDITPDALRYLRAFWPTFRARQAKLKLRLGRAFLDALIRPRNWSFDAPSPFEALRVADPEPDLQMLQNGLAELQQLFPALVGVGIAQSWGAFIDVTPDGVPVISPVTSLPGFYLATGFSGHGFGIGPGAGRLAADLVAGDAPIVDPHPFRYARMIDGTRLRPDSGL
jgi:glycine/D-amino acid oxidase-like deaminating enzyme